MTTPQILSVFLNLLESVVEPTLYSVVLFVAGLIVDEIVGDILRTTAVVTVLAVVSFFAINYRHFQKARLAARVAKKGGRPDDYSAKHRISDKDHAARVFVEDMRRFKDLVEANQKDYHTDSWLADMARTA